MQVLMHIMDWIPSTFWVLSILTQFLNWLVCFDWPLLDISFVVLESKKKPNQKLAVVHSFNIFLVILKKLHVIQKVYFPFLFLNNTKSWLSMDLYKRSGKTIAQWEWHHFYSGNAQFRACWFWHLHMKDFPQRPAVKFLKDNDGGWCVWELKGTRKRGAVVINFASFMESWDIMR